MSPDYRTRFMWYTVTDSCPPIPLRCVDVHSSALTMAISTIAVFVFTGLAAYKTQALKAWAHAGGPQGETLAIFGALSLYITFINLFLHILRLMGRRR